MIVAACSGLYRHVSRRRRRRRAQARSGVCLTCTAPIAAFQHRPSPLPGRSQPFNQRRKKRELMHHHSLLWQRVQSSQFNGSLIVVDDGREARRLLQADVLRQVRATGTGRCCLCTSIAAGLHVLFCRRN